MIYNGRSIIAILIYYLKHQLCKKGNNKACWSHRRYYLSWWSKSS